MKFSNFDLLEDGTCNGLHDGYLLATVLITERHWFKKEQYMLTVWRRWRRELWEIDPMRGQEPKYLPKYISDALNSLYEDWKERALN